MTGPEHYLNAEALLKESTNYFGETEANLIAKAQAHATLALAYATADKDHQIYGRQAAVTIKGDDL